MNNSEFKIGDRVEVVKDFGGKATGMPELGAKGTVIGESDWDGDASNGFSSGSDNVYIKMDEPYAVRGAEYSFLAFSKSRSGDLKLINENPKLKIGTRVEVVEDFGGKATGMPEVGAKGTVISESDWDERHSNGWSSSENNGNTFIRMDEHYSSRLDGKPYNEYLTLNVQNRKVVREIKNNNPKNFKDGHAVRILFRDKSRHAEPTNFPYGSRGWIKCENQAAASPNCWCVTNKNGETGSFHEDFLEPIPNEAEMRVKDGRKGCEELVTTTVEEAKPYRSLLDAKDRIREIKEGYDIKRTESDLSSYKHQMDMYRELHLKTPGDEAFDGIHAHKGNSGESEIGKLISSYPVAPDEAFLFGTAGTPVIHKGDEAPKTSAKKNKRTKRNKRNRYSSAELKGLKLNKI